MTPIYLDHASTAPLLPEVLDAMLPFLRADFGNPSSVHRAGRTARHAVETSRETIAELLGAKSEEILFTSGGTEANFLAIQACSGQGQVLSTSAEHHAIMQPMEALGNRARILPTNGAGRVEPWVVAGALGEAVADVSLASFILVNNELGSVNDLPALATACRSAGVLVHCDAVQAPVAMSIDVDALGVDLMTLSAHKFGGPKGIGVLYVRSGVPVDAPMPGGGQERKRRGGTENVAAIVGFARALQMITDGREARRAHLTDLNERMRGELMGHLGDAIRINSPHAGAAPHILNVGLPGVLPVQGSEMIVLGMDLEGVQVSAGSACSSGVVTPSHVLESIGRGDDAAVRFSFGASTSREDVSLAVRALARVAKRVKASH